MIKTPKGIEVHREFEPDMERMVHALKVVLQSKPVEEKDTSPKDQPVTKEETA
jgi:hypothetical protein